jgi:hypothetical protein
MVPVVGCFRPPDRSPRIYNPESLGLHEVLDRPEVQGDLLGARGRASNFTPRALAALTPAGHVLG